MNHVYRWLEGLEIRGAMVEIGSERGEQSTALLAAYARNHDLPFYSIDIDPGAHERAAKTDHCEAILGDGAAVMRGWSELMIGFTYLDSFDWIFPGMQQETVDGQIQTYKKLGYVMTNLNSWLAHLEQSMQVHRLAVSGAYCLFDDTWQREDGCYDGKGGAAVPWLLSQGWVVLKQKDRGVLLRAP